MEKQTKSLNVVQSDASYWEKLRAVEEFLGSPVADYLLNNCPRAWKLIVEYHKNLTDLVSRLELIKEVQLRLNDPMLSIEEKLQLRGLLDRMINYIEELKGRIQQLETQIIQEQQNNPQCSNLLSPLFPESIPGKTPPQSTPAPQQPCSELSRLVEDVERFIIRTVENHLKRYPFGSPWLMAHLGFIGYTDHGINHVERVLTNVDKITSELGIQLNDLENVLLKVAAYYHDYAMNFLVVRDIERIRSRDELRMEHASLSADKWIEDFEHFYKDVLSIYVSSSADADKIKNAVAEIIKNHSGEFKNYRDKKIAIDNCNLTVEVRVKLLSAILRLADEIDAGYFRLPQDATIGAMIVLGLCDKEYAKSIPHYMVNAFIDYIDITGNKLTIGIHPLKEDAVMFYPRAGSKRILVSYPAENFEFIKEITQVFDGQIYSIKELLLSKLEKELSIINNVLREYGYTEISTLELEESVPLPAEARFDRDLIYRGFQSFIQSEIGKNILKSCENLKNIKTKEDIYLTLKVR